MTESGQGHVIRSAARGQGHVMPRRDQPLEVAARSPGQIQDAERIRVSV